MLKCLSETCCCCECGKACVVLHFYKNLLAHNWAKCAIGRIGPCVRACVRACLVWMSRYVGDVCVCVLIIINHTKYGLMIYKHILPDRIIIVSVFYIILCQLYVPEWWLLRPVLFEDIFLAFGNIFESIFPWSSRKVTLLDFLSVLSGLQASMWIHMPIFCSTCHHSSCTCSSQTHISYSCSYYSIARYSISTILSKIPETQAPVLDWIQQI